MQLKKLKLVGFKSFVDPTELSFNAEIVGVVGPNGCGKSNVIDAVRWVMGESSAKNLRGGSMADVIFNGSIGRKPVSQASIELMFSNEQGKLGGEYASYAEISIKREVTRDGQSNYYLNGAKCRRRDVTDVFLGTGLGPRSYSIIEQGMISSVIDAKPEDVRLLFEEAAGISIYKKRRHDTALRMQHTKENLERIADLIGEQTRLLEKLKRQSRAAIRFNEYKEERDTIDLELDAMKWQSYDEKLQIYTGKIRELSTLVEEKLARRASIDNSLVKIRLSQSEKSHQVNVVQGQYYEIGADIARLEQIIQNHEDRKKQLQDDLKNAEHAFFDINNQLEEDQAKLDELTEKQIEIAPELEKINDLLFESEGILEQCQINLDEWNEKWSNLQKESQIFQRDAEVEKTKIEQLEKQIRQMQANIERLNNEKGTLNTEETEELITNLEMEIEVKEVADNENKLQIEEFFNEINLQRNKSKEITQEIDCVKGDIQTLKGRKASLDELQRAALGKDDQNKNKWLRQNGLEGNPSLLELLNVEAGYEKAVETVLGNYLEAVCIDDLSSLTDNIDGIQNSDLLLFENNTLEDNSLGNIELNNNVKLISKINTKLDLKPLIANVYVVDNYQDGLLLKNTLKKELSELDYKISSIITKDGLWLGNNWVRIYNKSDNNQSILLRKNELEKIIVSLEEKEELVGAYEAKNQEISILIKDLENKLKETQNLGQVLTKDLRELSSRLSVQKTRYDNIIQRSQRINNEIEDYQEKLHEATDEIQIVRSKLEQSIEKMALIQNDEEVLEREKELLTESLNNARINVKTNKENSHQYQLELQTVETMLSATKEGLTRLHSNLSIQNERKENIMQMLLKAEPKEEEKNELEALLEDRLEVEKKLSSVRDELEEIEQQVVKLENERKEIEGNVQDIRNNLDSVKMEWQSFEVRRDTLVEKFEKVEVNIQDIVSNLSAEANEAEWEERLDTLNDKIEKLGPINLAAIEEYRTESERAEYLKSQNADLTEALETLENAIKKIDRETKSKFKETFDQVNSNFKALFPKLFGGGEAYLELTGEDLLDTGVSIMARPPGKRNSSIQLLSGGEKALTAVSLVFAIFQLNPAPFCMLDEVDAPLDDSNVDRFCELIKEMSSKVQFIVITHNKITMEAVKHLTGVTMKEPGVSRFVSVDIDEAVKLTA